MPLDRDKMRGKGAPEFWVCVVKPGALADLLLVDGNPIENIRLIEDPAKNFLVIMKGGKIYKNLLPR